MQFMIMGRRLEQKSAGQGERFIAVKRHDHFTDYCLFSLFFIYENTALHYIASFLIFHKKSIHLQQNSRYRFKSDYYTGTVEFEMLPFKYK